MTKKKRVISIQINQVVNTRMSYTKFKEQFPDFQYNRKTKTYTLPPRIIKEIIIKKEKKKKKQDFQINLDTISVKTGKKKSEKFVYTPRFRQSVDYYFKGAENGFTPDGTEIGFISIKASTINPEYNETGLKIAVQEIKKHLELSKGIDFSNYNGAFAGYENKEIAPNEDKDLNDNKIHIQVRLNRKVTEFIR